MMKYDAAEELELLPKERVKEFYTRRLPNTSSELLKLACALITNWSK